ncbi:hypothetical protein [Paraburkholderia sp. BL25I1N1]|uniref:hypothetical protein n=1 Tax=Paraburkholderia sp. BL25I1N1 TaxID=1938804 RepID=UPI0011B1FCFE|nr:hypothetical protein [Paraburkholderia sp. BL25I1N1]
MEVRNAIHHLPSEMDIGYEWRLKNSPPERSFGFYASPSFLGRYGHPVSPQDLKPGQFMSYSGASVTARIVFRHGVNGYRSLLVSTSDTQSSCAIALVKAAIRGLGVIWVPHWAAESALYRFELVQIMHEWGLS